MPRYKLRTLLIVLALGPMVLAWAIWPAMRQLPAFRPEVCLGMSRNQVRAILGTPNARSPSHWVFWGERGNCSYRITVEFDRDTVQGIGSTEMFHD